MGGLTKEAEDGYEWAIKEVAHMMSRGVKPDKAMKRVGIESVSEILFFMLYLQEKGYDELLAAIRK